MSVQEHPAFKEEERTLAATLLRVDQESAFLTVRNQELLVEIARSQGKEGMDSAYRFACINLENNKTHFAILDLIKDQAYFARLDFCEEGSPENETIYLGKIGFVSRETSEVIVVDWREPIATLYYGGTEGTSTYEAPVGVVECEVNLKRQMEIENALIKRIVDTQISAAIYGDSTGIPTDEFLLSRLGQQSDRRLRDIVSTIQQEQNTIIRANLDQPLVVQGVAGSGKTTVALHRLAYLLYRYRDKLSPEDVLVIAPNRVFLTYISDVLPSLGVNDVAQSTLTEYLQNIYGKGLSVVSKKASHFHADTEDPYSSVFAKAQTASTIIKGSLAIKPLLEQAAQSAGVSALPRQPLIILGKTMAALDETRRRYLGDYPLMPPLRRLEELRKVAQRLAEKRLEEASAETQAKYERRLEELRRQRAQGSTAILSVYKDREDELSGLKAKKEQELSRYLDTFGLPNALEIYKTIMSDQEVLLAALNGEFESQLIQATAFISSQMFALGMVEEEEDLAPLAYLRLRLSGVSDKLKFKHIVIDEGQDLTALEISVLADLSGHDSITIVGDVSQSILPGRGLTDWKQTAGACFKGKVRTATLTLSYRTTSEIVNFSNSVLRSKHFSGALAKPVLRSGELPRLIKTTTTEEQHKAITTILRETKDRGHNNVAVIARSVTDAQSLYNALKTQGVVVTLLQDGSDEYEGGVQVMPVYLSKGLEFDAVIIVDADDDRYPDRELDAKLLYVALTRAMHELYVLHTGQLTPLLQITDKGLYQNTI